MYSIDCPSYNKPIILHHGRPVNGENRPLKRNQAPPIGESVRVTRSKERVARARCGKDRESGGRSEGTGQWLHHRRLRIIGVGNTMGAFDSTTRCAVCLTDPPRRIRQRMRDFGYSTFVFRFFLFLFFGGCWTVCMVGYGVACK